MALSEVIKGRLSCSTVTFSCRLDRKLAAMREAGFSATEIWPRDVFEDMQGPAHALALLAEHRIKVSAYQALRNFEGAPIRDRSQLLSIAENMMQQMSWIDCDLLVLPASSREGSSGDRTRIVTDLRELADVAASKRIRIGYENIATACWAGDYRVTWEVVQEVDRPNFGLLLDCFHMFIQDLPLDPIAAMDPAKIFLVEVSDGPRASLDHVELMRHHRLFPGDGVYPVREFVQRVEDVGYTGFYSVEVMNDHYALGDPLAVARRAMDSMANLFTV